MSASSRVDLRELLGRLTRARFLRHGGGTTVADLVEQPPAGQGVVGLVVAADLPASVLAYVGDAVYELFVRVGAVKATSVGSGALHKEVSARVRASAQARALHEILPRLTPEETDLVRRARNAKPSHLVRGVSPMIYRLSTAFEALLGYLFLSGCIDRLCEVVDMVERVDDTTGHGGLES